MTPLQHSLPIHEILVSDRFRKDLGNLEGLKSSLARIGLVQPIIVDRNKRLIAGGRRYAAAVELGWNSIPVSYRETTSQADYFEAELEENCNRKDFNWQEECALITRIHDEKKKAAALEGKTWGMLATSRLFNVTDFAVHHAIKLYYELQRQGPDSELAQSSSATDAWKVLMRQELDAARAELASRQAAATLELSSFIEETPTTDFVVGLELPRPPYGDKEQAREKYLSNPHNDPTQFDAYYESRLRIMANRGNIIPISSILHRADCLAYMLLEENQERFDHIITDPPYAIDMEMLAQSNTGMENIASVEAEHQVEDNRDLLFKFIQNSYACLKPNGFLILWCDMMQWQFLYNAALETGYKVQRWPFVWCKSHTCMNQSAWQNFTKATEIALICRKGTAQLIRTQPNNYEECSHDDFKDQLDHPFVKPFAVWQRLIEAVSLEGQLILDPFAGRGSGVISMLRCKRKVIGVELNDNHYNALLENVKRELLIDNPSAVFI